MSKSVVTKAKLVFRLRGFVFGVVFSLLAFTSVTAISTSVNAGDNDIAVAAGKLNWVPFGEGPAQMVVLWGDPKGDDYAVFMKFP